MGFDDINDLSCGETPRKKPKRSHNEPGDTDAREMLSDEKSPINGGSFFQFNDNLLTDRTQ